MTTTAALQPKSARNLSLRKQFSEIRSTSMRITEPFSAEDHMLQSMPDASPTKWHLAHTTWFFETFVLQPNLPDYKPYDDRYKFLFNSYYKQLGAHPHRGARGLMSRPSLDEVHAYRKYVDSALLDFIDQADPKLLELIELGLNHEQQHQELILTDIKHGLWSSPLPHQFVRSGNRSSEAAQLNWVEVEGGIYSIGYNGEGFSFDNECPRHEVLLERFRIASRTVTNAEYLEFIEDGGYGRPELWLSDGWDTVCTQRWEAPLYWERHDRSWCHFTMQGLKEVNMAEPVCHISFYEADAYARWRGARLPREDEWEVAASRASSRGTFLEAYTFQPQPVGGETSLQMFGDVWEWTSSPYVAYPAFKPAAGLIAEYNGKFMCNQIVLRGGSCATPASHIRASYRNFFPPQARWQFSGIRLAQ